jgi:cellulose synthase (UDP-forming)
MSRPGATAPVVDERRTTRRRRRRANRHLVDALSRRQRVRLAVLIAAWAVTTTWAWVWWLQPDHASSTTAAVVNSLLLSIETVLLPIWFYHWIWRMKRPDPRVGVPDLRTAMVVTKAPSEPWPVVRETLEAMLAQAFPRPVDTWLADEAPTAETRAWCARHGVRISSRQHVAAYHRPTWPRRTKCKEGNLAFFYDIWGYRLYDVVVQLDADHVPSPGYLERMVAPFTDPLVGYVAAPSICDRNAARSWAARGRLYAEAVLHGPTQAGHSGGYAPSCIGSHYAVRTQALQEIGGLGPELAEDFTTTLMMSSHGWQGVFAVDAEAHGDGPETLADCLTQEFQWSRSMMNVLLGVSRRYWTGLSLQAKVRLGFCQVWYPLFGLLMLASVAVPITAILTATPFMRLSLGQFYVHFGPAMLVLLLTVLWLRQLEWLRPRTARAVSWEMALFQLIRWPWALMGCVHAVAGRLAGREFAFKVTPKGREGAAPLPMRVVIPYLLLALASAAPMILQVDAGEAHGYLTLAWINVALYLTASMAILTLHVREHPRDLRRTVLRASTGKIAATAVATGVVVLGVLGGHTGVDNGLEPAQAAVGWPVGSDTRTGLTIGVTTDAMAKNSTTPWGTAGLRQVNAFEQTVRTHAGIVMWFADWEHTKPDLDRLRDIDVRGSVPEISWEPWDHAVGLRRAQSKYTLASILRGDHDAYISDWARTLEAFGKPVMLRFAQEMNGTWYPWSERRNGNHRGEFVQVWRYLHDRFEALGATNVQWVWSPVARQLDPSEYPGDRYVDVVGLSGFNGGAALDWTGWRSFAQIFRGSLQTLAGMAPLKPVQISEVSSAEDGGDKARWITDMFAELKRHPTVKSMLWFDLRKQTDWRVDSSPAAAEAFAAGAAARDEPAPPALQPPDAPAGPRNGPPGPASGFRVSRLDLDGAPGLGTLGWVTAPVPLADVAPIPEVAQASTRPQRRASWTTSLQAVALGGATARR